MKRKIRITSAMVKKGVLLILLVGLVSLFTVVVVKSFSKGIINSNNTQLKDIEYRGQYRTYLEKYLLISEYGEGEQYQAKIAEEIAIIENQIAEYRAENIQTIENDLARKIDALTKKCEEDKLSVEKHYQNEVKLIEGNDMTEAEKKLALDIAENERNQLIAAYDNQLVKDIEAAEEEKRLLVEELDREIAGLQANNTEENAVASLALKILNGRTLAEVINDSKYSPKGYNFTQNQSSNAIVANYRSDLTQALNSNQNGSVSNDTDTGYSFNYDGVDYIYSGKSGSLVYSVEIKEAGFYNLVVDYIPATNAVTGLDEESGGAVIERKILINGEIPYDAFNNVAFSRVWGDGGSKLVDISGNEIKPKQTELPVRSYQYVSDSIGYITEPYLVYFREGTHPITIESIRENFGIANIFVSSKEAYISYQEYKEQHADKEKVKGSLAYKIEGEGGESLIYQDGIVTSSFNTLVTRSSSTIYGVSDRVSSYNSYIKDGEQVKASPVKLVLNTIGGSKWSNAGDWVTWSVDVEESGLYQITLRAKQNISRGLFSTRKLSIDGEVPFSEAQNCKFVYKSNWSMVSLGDADGEAYYFYLEKGRHTITLECTLGDYAKEIDRVQSVIDDLNGLYRKIIQRTSISPDPYIDYFKSATGKKFIADAKVTFQEAIDTLNDVSAKITAISGEKSSETSSLETLGVQLQAFIKDYRRIQKSLTSFSQNIAALGTWIITVSAQSLMIDYLLIHTDDYKIPRANANFFGSAWFSIKGFVLSFTFDYESVGLTENSGDWETVEVWLCTSESQGREQANAISSMIYDASNAAANDPTHILHGINIVLKVVSPDVLLTATLAGRGPDVAINIANGTPVNYALRGATYDISQFTNQAILDYFGSVKDISSFQEIALGEKLTTEGGTRRFQNSAMTPYYFENGYYALPYTQSYLMMFYRTDMFQEYGWTIPKTWTEVLDLVPELQIMNFQFYLPLNTVGASSVVNQIFASYLYQNVSNTSSAFYRTRINEYGEEYLESNFDSEEAKQAFEFWCSFYTDFKFPLTASFVNRFRSGETPIGIVNYDIYNTLSVSAPEIRGKWGFALLPGTEKTAADGTKYIDNSGAASGTALTMMATTDKPFEAWAFMEWFTRADTQVSYAREIEAILGAAARHNTANVEAFTRLSWTNEEKIILLDQWEETVGVPEVAGGYYTGRNLENAFRYVVNNNENPNTVLADYILTINSEIDRKREEFGLSSSKKAATSNK